MSTNSNGASTSPLVEDLLYLGEQALGDACLTNVDFFECKIGSSAAVPVSGSVQTMDSTAYEGDPGAACARILTELWNNN